ncbi:MAG: hypothetical protein NC203_03785 [Firmicutes bacterium]|nr:hypothetical protein [[Eubacterium] siraeum]MCM1487468.1 hypothetical protein [Bacillota bacterium]
MISCTVSGVRLSFDFTFFGALALFLSLDKSGYGILCLSACFCHESAHLLVLAAEKNPPREIIFSGGGICIRQRHEPSLLALCAGCAVNLLLFGIFFLLWRKNSVFPLVFGEANLLVGAVNMLPIGELDGKKLLLRLLYAAAAPDTAEKISLAAEAAFTAAAAAILLLMIWKNLNLTGILILLYIFLVDFLEKRE